MTLLRFKEVRTVLVFFCVCVLFRNELCLQIGLGSVSYSMGILFYMNSAHTLEYTEPVIQLLSCALQSIVDNNSCNFRYYSF